jgi:hypothetical protein
LRHFCFFFLCSGGVCFLSFWCFLFFVKKRKHQKDKKQTPEDRKHTKKCGGKSWLEIKIISWQKISPREFYSGFIGFIPWWQSHHAWNKSSRRDAALSPSREGLLCPF